MLKLRKIALLILSVSTAAYGEQEYTNVTIKDVILNMDTGIHFRINESMTYNESCGSDSWFKVESATNYEKEALSILLTYEAQEKPVTIRMKGCAGGYPKLYYIY